MGVVQVERGAGTGWAEEVEEVGLLGLRGEGLERGVGLVGVGIMLGLLWVVSLEIGLIHGDFLEELMGVYFHGTALYSIRDRRAMNE